MSELVIVLDKGSYFTANKIKEFAAEAKIELLYLPTGMARLNPTEECWRQLRLALGNRYFGTVEELRTGIRAALDTIIRLEFINISVGEYRTHPSFGVKSCYV